MKIWWQGDFNELIHPRGENMDSTSSLGLYIKAIGTLVVTALTAYITALSDGHVNSVEWLTIAIAAIVSSGVVWAVPSTPEVFRKYGKTVAAGLVAFLSSLIVGLTDGGTGIVGNLSQAEIITAVVAGLTALGLVGSASNAASSDPYNPRTGKIHGVSYAAKHAAFVSDGSTP